MDDSQTTFQLVLDPELARNLQSDGDLAITDVREADDEASLQLALETAAAVVTIVVGTVQLAEYCAQLGRRITDDRRRKRIAVRGRKREAVLDIAEDADAESVGARIEAQARA